MEHHCSSAESEGISDFSGEGLELHEDSVIKSNGTVETSRKKRLWDVLVKFFVDDFSFAFFVPVMGTGMASSLLYNFPYPGKWLEVCGIILWGIAIFFFFVALASLSVVFVKDYKRLVELHMDISEAPFMGCLAMGYGTLLNMLFYLTRTSWIVGVWVLWWIEVVLSLYTFAIVFYVVALAKNRNRDNHLPPKDLNATLLLPVVTLSVAAASGGLFVSDLPSTRLKIITLVVCFIIWANAILMGLIIITIYFWKLIVYKIPSTSLVFSSFLPIGILGQGGFGILLFGHNIFELIMDNHSRVPISNYLSYIPPKYFESIGTETISYVIGSVILFSSALAAMFITAFGHYITFVAIISCLSKIRPFTKHYDEEFSYAPHNAFFFKRQFAGFIKFNRNFWAMTFPLGTMALSNTEFWRVFNGMEAFRVIGTIYAVTVIFIVLGCIIGIIYEIGQSLRYVFVGEKLPQTNFKV
ncbi:uncharacterized protein PRCAT00004364001 [Priceomyces carsonii]|uniref:uncharacterized protein n=1 Tax=Priceomyces carsonii TaxID=28549 RepID=UPI002ED78CF0|nr:unnamed protein product [Priceomyces carsonii]